MILTQVFKATQPRILLDELNRESGRIYSQVLVEHWRIFRKHGVWLSPFKTMSVNDCYYPGTTLHAHSRDAAQDGFYKACKTIKALKRAGDSEARYPHKRSFYRTTIWKNTGIRVRNHIALLARSRGLDPIQVELPAYLLNKTFVEARLVYNKRKSHYEWHFVTDDGITPVMRTSGASVAVDLGEIHPAVITDGQTAQVISARELRSTGQGLSKSLATLSSKMSHCKKGSRRYKIYARAKAKARRTKEARQKDILHKVSRAVVDYAESSNAKEIIIGDVRDIGDGIDIGHKANQKISLWPHGKLVDYITYKAVALGIATVLENEAYTSQTCPCCGEKKKPNGRVYTCKKCGFVGHRDVVGASNILSRHLYGALARVQVSITKYRHPYLTGKRSHVDTMQVAHESEKPR